MQRVVVYVNIQIQAETEHDLYLFALLLAACAKLTNPPQRNAYTPAMSFHGGFEKIHTPYHNW